MPAKQLARRYGCIRYYLSSACVYSMAFMLALVVTSFGQQKESSKEQSIDKDRKSAIDGIAKANENHIDNNVKVDFRFNYRKDCNNTGIMYLRIGEVPVVFIVSVSPQHTMSLDKLAAGEYFFVPHSKVNITYHGNTGGFSIDYIKSKNDESLNKLWNKIDKAASSYYEKQIKVNNELELILKQIYLAEQCLWLIKQGKLNFEKQFNEKEQASIRRTFQFLDNYEMFPKQEYKMRANEALKHLDGKR